MSTPAGGTDDRPNGEAQAGDSLKDRYRLLHCIAAGPRTDLWTARDEILDRTVLVKLLQLDAGDVTIRARFRSEALAVARLSHPGIVAVYDTLLEAGITGLVLEHVEATPLSRFLHKGGPISRGEAVSIALQVADALVVAHDQGIRHCNLSPDCVWLCGDQRVKITDFGTTWAHVTAAEGDSPASAWAQEQSDIRALAGVLRDCLATGDAGSQLPEQLAAFVAEADAPQEGGRFDSIAEARSFLAAARGVVVPAGHPRVEFADRGPEPRADTRRPASSAIAGRRRGLRALVIALVLAGAGAAAAVPALTGDDPPVPEPFPPDPPVVTFGASETPPAGRQPLPPPARPGGRVDGQAGNGESPAPPAQAAAPSADPGVAIVDVQVVTFRQQASPGDDPDALRTLDGDESTYWSTPGLSAGDSTVGGVGLEFRLAEPTAVAQLALTSDTIGWEAAVFVGDGGHGRLSDWGPLVDQQINTSGRMVLGLADQQAAAVLLWIPDPRAAVTDEIRIAEVIISAVTGAAVR